MLEVCATALYSRDMLYHWTNNGAKYRLLVHVVWCPKYRRAVLVDEIAERLREIMLDVAAKNGWQIQALEIMPNHVHALVSYPPEHSAHFIANQFKGISSRLLRQEYRSLRSRLPTLWSRSYFASSVDVDERAITEYIDTQYERPIKRAKAAV